jgi:hypothetical protein
MLPMATAVWLVDNTSLTFDQIAEFCGLHPLEVQGIADGQIATNIIGLDPVASGQLTWEEIERCQKDPQASLQLNEKAYATEGKTKGARYPALAKRENRPSAIAWLVRYHPELSDAQICRLVGTTKPTVQSIRNRTHWNIANIKPQDPVGLGFCKQTELDMAVAKSAKRKEQAADQETGN